MLKRAAVSGPTLDAALAADPLPGGGVAARGASEVVVWAPTLELDLAAPAAEQRDRLSAALAVVDALRGWYDRHGTALRDPAGAVTAG